MTKVTVYSQEKCSWCERAKLLLETIGVEFDAVNLTREPDRMGEFWERTGGATTVPQILVGDVIVGGFTELKAAVDAGMFLPLFGPDAASGELA